jgi:hypothetical protein
VHDPIEADPRWELRERLNGVASDLVQLSQGYIAVKNRDTRVNDSIAKSARDEIDWFQANLSEFCTRTRVSSLALVLQLDTFYSDHIRKNWIPQTMVLLEKNQNEAKVAHTLTRSLTHSLTHALTLVTPRTHAHRSPLLRRPSSRSWVCLSANATPLSGSRCCRAGATLSPLPSWGTWRPS